MTKEGWKEFLRDYGRKFSPTRAKMLRVRFGLTDDEIAVLERDGVVTVGKPEYSDIELRAEIPGMPKRWDAVLKRLPEGRVTGVEVGVWKGLMSTALLKGNENLMLWLVDCFEREYAKAETAFAAGRRSCIWLPSTEAAEQVGDRSFDFVFIDADHRYEPVKADILAWGPKVKIGGWLCGHDYNKVYKCGGVQRAVKELIGEGNYELDADDTWFVRVTGDASQGWSCRDSGTETVRDPQDGQDEEKPPVQD